MTGDKAIIRDLKHQTNLGKVTVASGDQFKITGIGSVKLMGEDGTVTITGRNDNERGSPIHGHLNVEDLHKLTDQVDGLEIKDGKLGNCSVCMESKTTRKVGKEKSAQVKKPGKELNLDLTFVNETPILMVLDTGSGCMFAKILEKK
ncbi:hypothetical protein HDU81_007483 [Chytriomyces hyalinus]|nr:hypothetical protein HDU81_007483 [Chytriomyces hyalinus]